MPGRFDPPGYIEVARYVDAELHVERVEAVPLGPEARRAIDEANAWYDALTPEQQAVVDAREAEATRRLFFGA